MRGFLIGTVATAVAFAVMTWLVPNIDYTGDVPQLILLALVAGVVNGLIKPIVRLLSLPVRVATLGLFSLVINAGMLLLDRLDLRHAQHPVLDRRLPAQVLAGRDRLGVRRRDRPEHRQHDHRALRRRLTGWSRRTGCRRSPAVCGPRPAATAPQSRSRMPRRSTRRVAELAAAFPDPWIRQYSVKANDVAAVVAARRRRRRAASGRTSSRAASGRSPGRPASGTTGSRVEGVGKTDADLRAAVRATAEGLPPLWLAIESADEAEALIGLAQRARLGHHARPPLDVLFRLNPDVAPETQAELAVGAGGSKFGMTETELSATVERVAAAGPGAATPRHPSPRRVAARGGRRLARCGPAWARGRRAAPRPAGGLRHARRRWRVRRRPARRAGAAARAVRPRDAGPARDDPGGSATAPARDRARAVPRRAGGLARRAGAPRPRAGRPAGRPRHRDDRDHPARALRRPPPDRRADLARPARGLDGGTVPPREVGEAAVHGPICESTDAARRAPAAAAPSRRPRRDPGRRRLLREPRLGLQRPAPSAAGDPPAGRHARARPAPRSPWRRSARLCPWPIPEPPRRRPRRRGRRLRRCRPARPGRRDDRRGTALPRAAGRRPRLRHRRCLPPGHGRSRRRDDPPDRAADRRRGRRLHPGRRGRPDDRGGRRRRPGADGPVGRRAEGLRRRPRDPVRHVPGQRARAGDPVRRPGLPGDVPGQRREAADLRRGHAAAAPRRRPRRRAARRDDQGRRGRDAGARRDAGAGPPARCRPRPPRRAAAVRRPRRGRRLVLAALRPRPGLSRRPVDPDGRPARGADAGRGRLRPRRQVVAPGADHRDAGPREPRPDRVPRGARAARASAARSASRPGRRPGSEHARPPATERRPAARPGGGARRGPAAVGDARRRGLHRARRPPRVRHGRPGVRQGARGGGRPARAGSRRSRRRSSPAGSAAASRSRVLGGARDLRRGEHPVQRTAVHRRRPRRRRHRRRS